MGLIPASPKGENVESSSEAAVERRNEAAVPFCFCRGPPAITFSSAVSSSPGHESTSLNSYHLRGTASADSVGHSHHEARGYES